MDVLTELHRKRDDILRIAGKHGVVKIRVFGSVARREVTETSDIDFVVARGSARSFFFPGGLIADLEELLGRPIDVATEKSLDPEIRDEVLREAIEL
jgi:hypothetical protein